MVNKGTLMIRYSHLSITYYGGHEGDSNSSHDSSLVKNGKRVIFDLRFDSNLSYDPTNSKKTRFELDFFTKDFNWIENKLKICCTRITSIWRIENAKKVKMYSVYSYIT